MKKVLLLAAIITGVLAYFSLTSNYSRNSTNYKGWPIPYQNTTILSIDQLLCHRSNSLLFAQRQCAVVMPTNNYFAVTGDIVLSALAGVGISFVVSRINKKIVINYRVTNTRYFKIGTIGLVIAIGLHFVPVYSQRGFLDHGMSNLCIGSTDPYAARNDDYRVITGGLAGFKSDKSIFTHNGAVACLEPVRLRLYIL